MVMGPGYSDKEEEADSSFLNVVISPCHQNILSTS